MSHPHQARVDAINRLLKKHPNLDGISRDRLLRERRSLLRIIHQVPLMAGLPVDWDGPSHPSP
jgi:hypothetical protein